MEEENTQEDGQDGIDDLSSKKTPDKDIPEAQEAPRIEHKEEQGLPGKRPVEIKIDVQGPDLMSKESCNIPEERQMNTAANLRGSAPYEVSPARREDQLTRGQEIDRDISKKNFPEESMPAADNGPEIAHMTEKYTREINQARRPAEIKIAQGPDVRPKESYYVPGKKEASTQTDLEGAVVDDKLQGGIEVHTPDTADDTSDSYDSSVHQYLPARDKQSLRPSQSSQDNISSPDEAKSLPVTTESAEDEADQPQISLSSNVSGDQVDLQAPCNQLQELQRKDMEDELKKKDSIIEKLKKEMSDERKKKDSIIEKLEKKMSDELKKKDSIIEKLKKEMPSVRDMNTEGSSLPPETTVKDREPLPGSSSRSTTNNGCHRHENGRNLGNSGMNPRPPATTINQDDRTSNWVAQCSSNAPPEYETAIEDSRHNSSQERIAGPHTLDVDQDRSSSTPPERRSSDIQETIPKEIYYQAAKAKDNRENANGREPSLSSASESTYESSRFSDDFSVSSTYASGSTRNQSQRSNRSSKGTKLVKEMGAAHLQQMYILLDPDGLSVLNWKCIAEYNGIKAQVIRYIDSLNKPKFLELLEQSRFHSYTIHQFKKDLKRMKRYDILEYLKQKNIKG